MPTIPRNHTNVIADIKKRATLCRLFALESNFTGVFALPVRAWEALDTYDFARLIDHGNGRWTVDLHDNRWFEPTEEDGSE